MLHHTNDQVITHLQKVSPPLHDIKRFCDLKILFRNGMLIAVCGSTFLNYLMLMMKSNIQIKG